MTAIAGAVLRLGLSDIAQLAHVQRPVVSMWRARSAGSARPFPAPIGTDRGQEWFDGNAVVDWLISTKRRNNPTARDDLAAYASLDGGSPQGDEVVFHGLTALLCLSVITGRPLDSMSRDRLIDLADEVDPDDDLLFGEIDALGTRLVPLARYTDLLVEAAFHSRAAFERLMGDRFRLYVPGHTAIALAQPARQLIAALALAVADQLDGEQVTLVDPTDGGSDLLIAVAEIAADRTLDVLTTQGQDAASRLARRRLWVHGIDRLPIADSGLRGQLSAGGVVLAQFPSPGSPSMTAANILGTITRLALETTEAHRMIVIGPAGVLTDALHSRADQLARDAILRSNRLRTIVRLPQGLLTARPRERMALLCFGSGSPAKDSRDRTILTADLSNVALDPAAIDDVVTDIVAGLGAPGGAGRRHPRFLRPALTRRLLTRTGDLVAAGAVPRLPTSDGSDLILRIDSLLATVSATIESNHPFHVALGPVEGQRPVETTVGAAVERGEIRMIPGHRLNAADVGSAGSVPVLGVEEITGSGLTGQRRIDRLVFASRYVSARSTEPGDVVFCTAPRPRAIVDQAGGSVVRYPARVARIADVAGSGISPRMMAADINALPASAKSWRGWAVRRVQPEQAMPVDQVLTDLSTHTDVLLQRVRALDELGGLVAAGAAAGAITVSPTNEQPRGL